MGLAYFEFAVFADNFSHISITSSLISICINIKSVGISLSI